MSVCSYLSICVLGDVCFEGWVEKRRGSREEKEREMASLSDGVVVAWTRRATPSTHTRKIKFFFLSQISPFLFCFKFRSVEYFTQFTTNFPFFFQKNTLVFFTEYQRGKYKIFFSRWLTQFSQGLQHSSWPEVVTTHMANLADP